MRQPRPIGRGAEATTGACVNVPRRRGHSPALRTILPPASYDVRMVRVAYQRVIEGLQGEQQRAPGSLPSARPRLVPPSRCQRNRCTGTTREERQAAPRSRVPSVPSVSRPLRPWVTWSPSGRSDSRPTGVFLCGCRVGPYRVSLSGLIVHRETSRCAFSPSLPGRQSQETQPWAKKRCLAISDICRPRGQDLPVANDHASPT